MRSAEQYAMQMQTQRKQPRRRRRWFMFGAVGAALLVGATMAVGLASYWRFDGNIRTDGAAAEELAQHGAERPKPAVGEAQNILLLGSDYREELGSARSDTTMLLHLSADRSRVEVVSVPRDLYANIPVCRTPDGDPSRAQRAQFNWAYEFGGAACTIRTFERLTGIRIDHHLVLNFGGFKKIVSAVGGVVVDLPTAERDPNVGLDLPAGRQVVMGDDALAYVRARMYVGDGSDINRIHRQQEFLTSLGEKLRSSGVLANPARLYPILDATTSAITADSGLDSLGELYGMIKRVREVPPNRVRFITVPHRTAPDDPNRLVLEQPQASRLFASLREDRPADSQP
ncbi:LCP family protein [Streptomyces sp. NPDC002896]|uniref:LCP family protein n=1 Tax=Streptomyces sp. NPDC002896 TaxID=3154438 RepID=UPI00331B1A8D